MTYLPLGSKQVTAAADQTGLNTGNWTNAFTAQTLGIRQNVFECYGMTVQNIPRFAQVTVYVNNRVRTTAQLVANAEWDPAQPMLLTAADEVYLCWNIAAAGAAPVATLWLRYDPAAQPAPLVGG